MQLKYAITMIVIVCAVILAVLTAMGPKLGLQTPPIEPKAMAHLEKMNILSPGEKLVGYKATSYYSYGSAVVVTDKRIFAYHRDTLRTSIPLDKITMVIVKDTELGHQEVMVSAQADGVIGVDLHHSDVQKFLSMLHVSNNLIKHFNKQEIKAALQKPAAGPAATR